MTPEQKKQIDEIDMARLWRFAPVGEPLLQGEVGEYFAEVFKAKGRMSPEISKQLGW